ncbi:efflux RND transporter periplasmic adaptor subunit [Magnetococcales bacterium HHB-1]
MKRVLRWILPLLIIVGGVTLSIQLIKTAPKTVRKPRPIQAPLVEIIALKKTNYPITITAMGVVEPAQKITLQSRVSGEIQSTHPDFMPGGLFKKGVEILRIDDQDYRSVWVQRQSDLSLAKANLDLEAGKQRIAARDYRLLKKSTRKTIDTALALRKPQWLTVQSAHRSAKAAVVRAQSDLDRTKIRAPFNALVLDQAGEVGAQITPSTALATLVATDRYWVKVALPVSQLKWIMTSPQQGAFVEVIFGENRFHGRVIRLLGNLSDEGRLAQLLVEVKDPLGLEKDKKDRNVLLLNAFVQVNIKARTVQDVIVIPRRYVRENQQVWLLDQQNRLEKRTIQRLYQDREHVLVLKGVDVGERLVISNLSSVVARMPLRLLDEEKKRVHTKKERSKQQPLR